MRQVHLEGPSWPPLEATLEDLAIHRPELPIQGLGAVLAEAEEAWRLGDGARLAPLLVRLGISGWTPTTEPPWPCPTVPSDAAIARVALDRAPDAGELAPHALLGPWAQHLDLHRPAHRRAWVASVAASAFALHQDDTRSPMRSFLREARRGRSADHPGWLSLRLAPVVPWELVEVTGGLGVRPLVPLARAHVPHGPVDLDAVGAVTGGFQAGDLLVGRVVLTQAGPAARTALALPGLPSARVLRGWVQEVLVPLRAWARALDVEDALRGAGHRLIAGAHHEAWGRRRAPTP